VANVALSAIGFAGFTSLGLEPDPSYDSLPLLVTILVIGGLREDTLGIALPVVLPELFSVQSLCRGTCRLFEMGGKRRCSGQCLATKWTSNSIDVNYQKLPFMTFGSMSNTLEMLMEAALSRIIPVANGAVQAMVVIERFLVQVSLILRTESLCTCLAFECFRVVIRVHVHIEIVLEDKASVADLTIEWPRPVPCGIFMLDTSFARIETAFTRETFERSPVDFMVSNVILVPLAVPLAGLRIGKALGGDSTLCFDRRITRQWLLPMSCGLLMLKKSRECLETANAEATGELHLIGLIVAHTVLVMHASLRI